MSAEEQNVSRVLTLFNEGASLVRAYRSSFCFDLCACAIGGGMKGERKGTKITGVRHGTWRRLWMCRSWTKNVFVIF